MTRRDLRVAPHDPAWGAMFEAEGAAPRSVLGDEALSVHHIGSTSVPGLPAKPTLDALAEVREITKVGDFDGTMAEGGYEASGECGIPRRRFFTKDRGSARTHNVHVFEAGTNDAVGRHLAFRDYLIGHPQTARTYARSKKDLAKSFPADVRAYTEGTDSFLKGTEREAHSWSRIPEGGKLKC